METYPTSYLANSMSSLNLSLNLHDSKLGELVYDKWYSNSASIHLTNGNSYRFESKGFLSSKIKLKAGDKSLLEFETNWNGIKLNTLFDGKPDQYQLSLKGFWSNVFLLKNSMGATIAEITADFEWRKLSYDFQISTLHGFEVIAEKEVFLLALLHCLNYYLINVVNGS